jgi:hypothetical protein
MKILNGIRRFLFRAAFATVALFLILPVPGRAQSAPPVTSPSLLSPIEQYFIDWFPRVTRIQSEQPRWITPLVTVTPRLEEEYRYDQLWQAQPHGKALDNFGGTKGLELIPFQNTEIILGVPGWVAHNGALPPPPKKGAAKPDVDGWADETFLVKYRLLSANEESGNYILTVFMGFSAPTGSDGNSSRHALFTPTVAFGKDGVTSIFRARWESRFPTAACSALVRRSLTIPPSSTACSGTSGPNSR